MWLKHNTVYKSKTNYPIQVRALVQTSGMTLDSYWGTDAEPREVHWSLKCSFNLFWIKNITALCFWTFKKKKKQQKSLLTIFFFLDCNFFLLMFCYYIQIQWTAENKQCISYWYSCTCISLSKSGRAHRIKVYEVNFLKFIELQPF